MLDSKISNEFYNKIEFPLEISDTPVRAVYYNGNISQEDMDEFSAEISDWPILRTDFISPTCARQIYNSALNSVTGKRNEYWLYFVDKKLRLASLYREGSDRQLSHKQDMEMLSSVDPSLYQARLEIMKTIISQGSGNTTSQESSRKGPIDYYLENSQRREENEAQQKYMDSMLDLERQRLQIQKRQTSINQGSSYNTNCRYTGSGQLECQSSPSSTIIDLR